MGGPVDAATANVRFLTIPADITTEQSPVELRLSIQNPTTTARTFQVEFSLNTEPIGAALRRTVAARSEVLVTRMWDPRGRAGEHSIRYRVSEGTAPVADGAWPVTVVASETRAPAGFGGVWLEPGHVLWDKSVTPQDIRARVDEMHAFGMDTIIIAYVEYAWNDGGGPYYPSRIPELGAMRVPFDVVGTIMDQAAARGMHVVLGLGRGPNGPLDFDEPVVASHEEMDAAAAFSDRVAAELWSLYGTYASFYGWYLTHEANTYSNAKYYYDRISLLLDKYGAEKPVVVAPAGTPLGISPESLNDSQADIFAYQDAVGAGYVGPGHSCATCLQYTYTYEPYNRIDDLEQIFSKYASWHEGTTKHIWADTEIWQMDGPTYGDAYAAPCARVRDQIAPERRHVSMLTAYEFFGYMRSQENANAMARTGAAELYEGYERFVDGRTAGLCPDDPSSRGPVSAIRQLIGL